MQKTLFNIYGFHLRHTVLSGQCFDWMPFENGYAGVIENTFLHVTQVDNCIMVRSFPKRSVEEIKKIVSEYFSFNCDYQAIIGKIQKDPYVARAVEQYYGLRLVKQPKLSCFISFLISSNNSFTNIVRVRNRLAENFGTLIYTDPLTQKKFYAFPTLAQLKHITLTDFQTMKAGYRSIYLFNAIHRLKPGFLDSLAVLPYQDAKNQLLTFNGIGEKVADCILLYAYPFDNVYPTDTWVKRFTKKLYFLDEQVSETKMRLFAMDHFNGFAGWAQLYLYIYFREKNVIRET